MTLPPGSTLRPVAPADARAFHTVMLAVDMDPRSSWSRTTVADLEKSLGQPGAGGFLALVGERVVGCVGYRPDGPQTLTLNKLATLPEVRGQGLGVALVRAVEEMAAREGYDRVLLAVSQYNLEVQPFYERLGYRVDGEAVYAFSSPGSMKPVVLVRTVLDEARLKCLAERGYSLRSLIDLCKQNGCSPVRATMLFARAFGLPIREGHDVGGYVESGNILFLENLRNTPQIKKHFGKNIL